MNLAIETQALARSFGGVLAVDGIDVQVERGTFYGFLGPNGAGKSTTIKMLTGLLAPTSGSMRVLGRDPCSTSEAIEIKRRVGVVPENLALFDNLTAMEYLIFVGRMHLLPSDVIRDRGQQLLDLLRLEADPKKVVLEFSHGMKKKLALAAALLPNPELLFLDEPFEGVDAVTSRAIREVLAHVVERGATVFLTSHVLEIVERLCTHVGIIAQGKLAVQGSLQDVRGDSTLENRFIETIGGEAAALDSLAWLRSDSENSDPAQPAPKGPPEDRPAENSEH